MSKLPPKITAMKKAVEVLTLKMQFFHLDPKKQDYQDIINNGKICSEQSNVIDIWKNACLVEYGDIWGLYESEITKSEALLQLTKNIQDLTKKFENKPNATLLDRIWYMFFATGDYNFLHIGFEAIGHPNATVAFRKDALTMYETIRDGYMTKITEAKQHDANYFINHSISNTRNAPSCWERLDNEIAALADEPEKDDKTTDDEISNILNADKSLKYKFVSTADAKKTPEELENDKKIDRGIELFNKLLNDINEKETKNELKK